MLSHNKPRFSVVKTYRIADLRSRALAARQPSVSAERFWQHPGQELARWYDAVKDDPEFLRTLVASTPTPTDEELRSGDYLEIGFGQYFDEETGIFYQTTDSEMD